MKMRHRMIVDLKSRTRFRINNVKPQDGFRKRMDFNWNGFRLRFKDFEF